MPTYEYQCKKCGTVFSLSGDYYVILALKKECPVCKALEVVRKFRPIPFRFKNKED